MKMEGGVGAPWLCLAVDVEHAGQQFDFVAEQFERDDTGKVGQVLVFDVADRHGLSGSMEVDGILDGTVELLVQDDVDIGQAEGRLVNGQSRRTVGLGGERQLPWASAGAEMVIGEERARVKDRGQDKGCGEVPQHTDFSRGCVQLNSALGASCGSCRSLSMVGRGSMIRSLDWDEWKLWSLVAHEDSAWQLTEQAFHLEAEQGDGHG
jgi:hypothetical protein